ncbi:cutinase-domain-containing protein [Bisporella sp. PMI_857]|nr:cutinase-domain-containing protein [Bisporella sp. PMI_857]
MKYTTILSSLLALTSALPAAQVEQRQAVQTTRNELITGACKKVTIIFGRGSGQPGNVGSIVGPPFFTTLSSRLGASNVAVQGVDYPATYEDAVAGGSRAGAATLVSLAQLASSKCPNTQIVLSGYRYVVFLILRMYT